MTDVLSLIRPDLKGFGGYSSAAKEGAGAKPALKLDANESPWPPFGSIAGLCAAERYAEPQPQALRERMAAYWGVGAEEILLTCGSDQGIDALLRLFCAAGEDEILVCPPTFSMYAVYAQIQGARVLSVPLREDGQLDLPAMAASVTDKTKLIFIPTPNAPMGNAMKKEDLLALCASREGKSVIVADEAYVEFSDASEGLAPFINKIPNLVLLRTLSKAHGLAGERVGCVIAPQELVAVLRGIVPPYPLAQSAVQAAMDAFSPAGLAQSAARRTVIRQERAYLAERLAEDAAVLGIRPSEGNFLFLETTGSQAFLARLSRLGIRARSMESQKKGAVRLTVAKPEDNDLVLEALGLTARRKAVAMRCAGVQRVTKETAIEVMVNLDVNGEPRLDTGIGFLDHMLAQIAAHGGFEIVLKAVGDRQVDDHHTIEDCALALGEAIQKALGDKKGVARFGFTAPLDEAVANVVLDLSGRPFAQIEMKGPASASDGMAPDLAEHFFRSFATSLGATLHVTATGANNHHMIEACFKALGRALRQAVARDGSAALPSTKGAL